MAKLSTLKPKLATLPSRIQSVTTSTHRVRGSKLQARRQKLWLKADAKCERCGCVVSYPDGFDLDHIMPLYKGGRDIEENLQVLCNGPAGCHAAKTREDAQG